MGGSRMTRLDGKTGYRVEAFAYIPDTLEQQKARIVCQSYCEARQTFCTIKFKVNEHCQACLRTVRK